MRFAIPVLMALTLLSGGCAGATYSYGPSASPSARDADYCERNAGVWHGNLGICEIPDR